MIMRFFFPTPYTPEPIETMDVPFGAVGMGDQYQLQGYGVQPSGITWGQVPDYDELHAPENSPGYAGPTRFVQGTVIQAGTWRNRRGPG